MGRSNKFEVAQVKVYITKNGKFRAKIKEQGREPYEVSLGGRNWDLGVGRKYEHQILNKAAILSRSLIDQLNALTFKQAK